VRDLISVDASSTGDPTVSASSTLTATISGIQLEIEVAPPPSLIFIL
jgi:hypothetical protein